MPILALVLVLTGSSSSVECDVSTTFADTRVIH
jgi:hypothetical protein